MSERSRSEAHTAAPGSATPWVYAACGALGLAAGAAAYVAEIGSPLAALVVAWYVAESLLVLARLIRPPRREGLLRAVLPRAAGTGVALPLAHLLAPAWPETAALAYLILIALEGAYRTLGRRLGWFGAYLQAAGPPRSAEEAHSTRALLAGLIAAAAVTALLMILTLYAQGTRAVLLDARLYAGTFQPLGLYERLLDAAGTLLVDAARQQGGQVRRAVELAAEQELEAATRLALPEVWTAALFEQALASTFSWLEGGTPGGVPPLSVPVADLQHHLKGAVSFLFDQVAPRLPTCTEHMSREALCRPEDMSVTAFVAFHKPEALAMVDESLALLPGEIDLATAVTMSPRTFRALLGALAQAGEAVTSADRALAWSGWASLVACGVLVLLSARSAREATLWGGIVLLAAGAGAWGLSWSIAGSDTESLLLRGVARTLPGTAEAAFLPPLLAAALRAIHGRIWPVELAGVALGGLALLVGLALPANGHRRWRPVLALRAVAATGAAIVLLWAIYLRVGERAYERANAAYREGEVRSALARYQGLLRAYPVGVRRTFVSRAQRDARACALAVDAADALRERSYDRAAATYEALLVGNPPVVVRDAAAENLLTAWLESAAALRAEGAYERALDRLRLAHEALGSRTVYEPMAALYLEWGDTLLAGGDYEAAAATYGRIRYDVPSARHWRVAEERAANAYCAWQAVLRDAGDEPGAAWVCGVLAEALPRMVGECTECGR